MNLLEYILLGMLMEGTMSGYDLKKTIDSTVGTFYKASYGSLYPALKRLADKGMVTLTETDNSKNKKLYTLLPSGRIAFLEWLSGPMQSGRNEQLIRIFFLIIWMKTFAKNVWLNIYLSWIRKFTCWKQYRASWRENWLILKTRKITIIGYRFWLMG